MPGMFIYFLFIIIFICNRILLIFLSDYCYYLAFYFIFYIKFNFYELFGDAFYLTNKIFAFLVCLFYSDSLVINYCDFFVIKDCSYFLFAI